MRQAIRARIGDQPDADKKRKRQVVEPPREQHRWMAEEVFHPFKGEEVSLPGLVSQKFIGEKSGCKR